MKKDENNIKNKKSFLRKINILFDKINNHFFILLVVFIAMFVISEKVLNIFNMSFRFWFQCLAFTIFLIVAILGIIKLSIKNEKVRNILKKVCIALMFVLVFIEIFWQYTLFFISVIANCYNLNIEEYVIDTDTGKKVVYVRHFFGTNVEVHDYYNKFLCSYDYDVEYYDGTVSIYDIEKRLNEKNNISTPIDNSQNKKEDIIKNIKPEIAEGDEILYKEKFGDVTVAVVSKGEWNDKCIVQILKSQDNENTWLSMLQNEYGVMYVSDNTEFIFFNEDFGYYLDNNTNEKYQELKYTYDGGKSFGRVKLLIGETEIGDKEYVIKGLPFFEDGEYKLKLKVYFEDGEKEYILHSDNGMSFKLNEEEFI